MRLLTSDERPSKSQARRQHVWSDDEINDLITASANQATRSESRYDYTRLLRVAVSTGLRLGELLGLQWQDIDFAGHEILVRRQWTRYSEYTEPKTSQAVRRIPVSSDVITLLAEHKLAVSRTQPQDPVFASRTGTPLSHRNVQRRGFGAAAEAAGLHDVTFHDLRHAFASRMIARGLTSTVLCRIMGHSNPGITERVYVHLFDKSRTDDAVRAAMSR